MKYREICDELDAREIIYDTDKEVIYKSHRQIWLPDARVILTFNDEDTLATVHQEGSNISIVDTTIGEFNESFLEIIRARITEENADIISTDKQPANNRALYLQLYYHDPEGIIQDIIIASIKLSEINQGAEYFDRYTRYAAKKHKEELQGRKYRQELMLLRNGILIMILVVLLVIVFPNLSNAIGGAV